MAVMAIPTVQVVGIATDGNPGNYGNAVEAPVSDHLKPVVEALIFASPEPLTRKTLYRLLDGEPREDVDAALASVRADYESPGGLQLVEVAGGNRVRNCCSSPRSIGDENLARSNIRQWSRRVASANSAPGRGSSAFCRRRWGQRGLARKVRKAFGPRPVRARNRLVREAARKWLRRGGSPARRQIRATESRFRCLNMRH